MKKWEYKLVGVEPGEKAVDKLNEAGSEGWEFSGTVHGSAAYWLYLMKRPVEAVPESPKPVDNKFFGDQTVMVYIDGDNQGRCRLQTEMTVQRMAETTPGTIYYFWDEEAFLAGIREGEDS